MTGKKIKNPSVVAYDGFFYKATRKGNPRPKRHWSWPESNDAWALESVISSEAENGKTEALFEFMHEVIDINYNNAVYSDFNTSRLARVVYVWNRAKGTPFTNSDIYWMCGLAWKKWAKSVEQKIEDFKNGRIRTWRERNG